MAGAKQCKGIDATGATEGFNAAAIFKLGLKPRRARARQGSWQSSTVGTEENAHLRSRVIDEGKTNNSFPRDREEFGSMTFRPQRTQCA
eukprot:183292-Pleurochrysis_carterae.AAC.2